MVGKTGALFFCRYETVHGTGTSVDCDAASEYHVLTLGGRTPELPSVYNERYHNGKQICQHVIFNTKPGGIFNANVRSASTYRQLPFLLKKIGNVRISSQRVAFA
jgi:hypothetical protein